MEVRRLSLAGVKARTVAQLRLAFVLAVIRFAEEHKMTEREACEWVSATEAETYAALGGVSYGTFNRLKKAMRGTNGQVDPDKVERLIPQTHRCGRRGAEAQAAFLPFLEAFLAKYQDEQCWAFDTLYKLLRRAKLKDGSHPETIPSEYQVTYWLKTKVPAAELERRRLGDHRTLSMFGHVTRDWSNVKVNQVWIGDTHTCDAPCKVWDAQKDNGPGKPQGGWRAVRPKIVCWMDGKSAQFVGMRVCVEEEPSRYAIEDAFLEGLCFTSGEPPVEIYIDNGKDYCAQGFADPVIMPDGTAHCIIDECGVRRVRHSNPYNARAKTIERAFVAFAKEFSKLWPGYRGSNTVERPESAQWWWDHPELLPDAEEYERILRAWIWEVRAYMVGEHSKVSEGKTPAEAWETRKPLGRTLSLEQVRFAMMRPLPRPYMVRNGGEIHCGRASWVPETDVAGAPLYDLLGRADNRVMLKLDWATRDQFALVAFDFSGRMLCRLKPKTIAQALCEFPEDYAILAEAIRESKHARVYQRDAWKAQGLPARREPIAKARAQLMGIPDEQTRRLPPPAMPSVPPAAVPVPTPKAREIDPDIRAAMEKIMFGHGEESVQEADVHVAEPAVTPDTGIADTAEATDIRTALANLGL
jgi:hypothetical protein